MKSMHTLITSCLFLLCILSACTNRNDTSVTIRETKDSYQFSASYNKNKDKLIHQCINISVEPDAVFPASDDDLDVTRTLLDSTIFYIRSSPGRLTIKLDKEDNNLATYTRMKERCEMLKNIITSK